jgi:hypothetical protein
LRKKGVRTSLDVAAQVLDAAKLIRACGGYPALEDVAKYAVKVVGSGSAPGATVWLTVLDLGDWLPSHMVHEVRLAVARDARLKKEEDARILRERRDLLVAQSVEEQAAFTRLNEARASAGRRPFSMEDFLKRRAEAARKKEIAQLKAAALGAPKRPERKLKTRGR